MRSSRGMGSSSMFVAMLGGVHSKTSRTTGSDAAEGLVPLPNGTAGRFRSVG